MICVFNCYCYLCSIVIYPPQNILVISNQLLSSKDNQAKVSGGAIMYFAKKERTKYENSSFHYLTFKNKKGFYFLSSPIMKTAEQAILSSSHEKLRRFDI